MTKVEDSSKKETMKMAYKYTVRYSSNSQRPDSIQSNSRAAKKHGHRLLGTKVGGGSVKVYRNSDGKLVSMALYSSEGRGNWYSAAT